MGNPIASKDDARHPAVATVTPSQITDPEGLLLQTRETQDAIEERERVTRKIFTCKRRACVLEAVRVAREQMAVGQVYRSQQPAYGPPRSLTAEETRLEQMKREYRRGGINPDF